MSPSPFFGRTSQPFLNQANDHPGPQNREAEEMANTFAPFGFKQFRHLEGNQPTMGFETFRINSSDPSLIFTGDPVVTYNGVSQSSGNYFGRYITGSSQVGTTFGTSVAVLGIFLGCKFYNPSVARMVWSPYWPGNQQAAGPDVEAYVCTDPNMLWTVQASTTTLLGTSNIGYGIGYTIGQSSVALNSTAVYGNQTTGQSQAALVSSGTLAATSSYPFIIYDFAGTYSGGAGMPSWDISPNAGALSNFVNGMDPTSAGAVLIVKGLNWVYNFGGALGL